MNRPLRPWLLPAGLLFLSIIPAIAGTVRLLQIAQGATVTPENTRFLTAPVPAALHIVSVVVYCMLGAFQFVPRIRSRYPAWHRWSGRVLVPAGLIASLSGLWMTFYYAWPQYDGQGLYLIRIVVGTVMTYGLIAATTAILNKDIARHRAWMMRAYALGLGAGTQVLTHIPWLLLPDYHNETFRTISMAAGWGINVAVVEWRLSGSRFRAQKGEDHA